MDTASTVSGLNIFTIGIVLLIAVGLTLYFFSKRKNRHPMEYANPREEAAVQAERQAEIDQGKR